MIIQTTLMLCYYLQVYGVQAYENGESIPFYRELADKSGGFYLKLSHFDLITDMFLAGKILSVSYCG